MKNFILFIFLCISAKSFGGIYKIQDNERNCVLYFSESSQVSKTIDIAKLERESVTASLVFQKFEDKYSLKGLYSMFAMVHNVHLDEASKDDFLKYTFNSVCLSDQNKVVYFEKSRKLFNNLNDLDRE